MPVPYTLSKRYLTDVPGPFSIKFCVMTKRALKPAVTKPRHRASSSRAYEHPIVPIEDIAEAAHELRADHPKVSDEQAHFVHLIVQTGKSPAQLAKLTGKTKNWLYYNMSKAAVCDYRQAVAMRVLGWDSAAALSTMRQLLTAKSSYIRLEAAKDLLDRAGLRTEAVGVRSPSVMMTFNLNPMAQGAAGNKAAPEPARVVDVTVEQMGPVEAFPEGEGGLKTASRLEGRDPHSHHQGPDGIFADIDSFTV
jgi:hypothetical protein